MIKKILIANRGEIAVRIIRAAKELKIKSVIVYSEADTDSLAVKLADKAIKIGPSPSKESYLFYQNILSAALSVGAEAIHPGYGFLAENASFAQACKALNIIFIGPTALAIQKMGDKSSAREIMKSAGVPIIPGSLKPSKSFEDIKNISNKIGFPLIIKASAGGGGKGMRIVKNAEELLKAFNFAYNESEKAFGDSRLYVEKYIIDPKHIEFQILSDGKNTIHLFERDCSLQRKHQKLLEETPCLILDNKIRKKMSKVSILAAQSVNYNSAGTVEFLFDTKSENFYFIEMNTRIQVEHPITEEITGIDLIKEQIKIASGEKLDIKQKDVKCMGHAIECRINAEDPDENFRPNPGKITQIIFPGGPGIRIDSGVYPNYEIPPYYDSMIAKVIAHGKGRKDTIDIMKRALDEFIIEGICSTIPFHKKILNNKYFLNGSYSTTLLENI